MNQMRSRSIRGLFLACVTLVGVVVSQSIAQTTAPATTMPPTTAPASIPVNTSTPRGALKVLLSAIQLGDPEGIRKVIHATTPIEKGMVEAMANRVVAENKFRQAAIKAFGNDAAKQLVGDAEESNTVNMLQVDASAEQIDGESAVVSSGESEPVKLMKVNGQWQVPASEFSKNTDPTKIQQGIDDNNFAASLIEQFAGEVSAGKYKTATEASEAIQLQMRAAVMRRAGGGGGTTQPATGPTTGPG